MINLPNKIAVFPLPNFIIFPDTSVPLNIFEPRYVNMINDSIQNDRMIGMIQPKQNKIRPPQLYEVGCLGKITSFSETNDGRYLIVLNGISRFDIISEVNNDKKYRECMVDYKRYSSDIDKNKEKNIKFSDLELIFKNLKDYFKKQGYLLNWKELENQSLDQTINTLSMAAPFSLEEKQALLETLDINSRKNKLEQILNTYISDNFSNKTLQ